MNWKGWKYTQKRLDVIGSEFGDERSTSHHEIETSKTISVFAGVIPNAASEAETVVDTEPAHGVAGTEN